VTVTVDSSGTQVVYGRTHDLSREHSVSIPTTTQDTIKFDARGFATNAGTTAYIVLTRDGLRDSVCVSKLGKIITRGCSL
jgi:hypothetical protein